MTSSFEIRGSLLRREARARGDGFTIVELVSVLLLLGILSAVALSRLVGDSAFAPAFAADEIVAFTRLAQQTALARQDAAVRVEVVADGTDWRLRVRVDPGTGAVDLREQRVARKNTAIVAASGATSLPLSTSPLVLAFDGLGALASATIGAVTLDPSIGVALTVTGDASYAVCIESTGHAMRGTCA